MSRHPQRSGRWGVVFGVRLLACAVALLGAIGGAAHAQSLPPEVEAAFKRAQIPPEAVSIWLAEADGSKPPRLAWQSAQAVQPASLMKLVSTYAALDLLGPQYQWRTPVLLEGAVREGTLYGNLVIQGQGDPTLVVERAWLLMRRVRALGIHTIAGDIVLDRSAFAVPPSDPGTFDGEPLRPYNTTPDALVVNYKALVLALVPDALNRVAHVQAEPPLAGVSISAAVPLTGGECADWQSGLQADFTDPLRITLSGSYAQACGERTWPVAYAEPQRFNHRAIGGLWQAVGGRLQGQVRDGVAPPGGVPLFELRSSALAEVVRDINKNSNNLMARQLMLTLAWAQGANTPGSSGPRPPATIEGARAVVQSWWLERIARRSPNGAVLPGDDAPLMDNGSGLSRSERISAQGLGRLLQVAWASPLMPELMASLPLAGVDGTLRRSRARPGSAHLKTGSLANVTGVAGYVHASNGRRWVLVAIVNHPRANAARPALDNLIDWAGREP